MIPDPRRSDQTGLRTQRGANDLGLLIWHQAAVVAHGLYDLRLEEVVALQQATSQSDHFG